MIYIHLACLLFISIIFLHSNCYCCRCRIAGGLLVATSSVFCGLTNIVVFICLLFCCCCCCFVLLLLSISLSFCTYLFLLSSSISWLSLARARSSVCMCWLDLIIPYFTLQMNNQNEMYSHALWRKVLITNNIQKTRKMWKQIIALAGWVRERMWMCRSNANYRMFLVCVRVKRWVADCVVVCVWRIIILLFIFFILFIFISFSLCVLIASIQAITYELSSYFN